MNGNLKLSIGREGPSSVDVISKQYQACVSVRFWLHQTKSSIQLCNPHCTVCGGMWCADVMYTVLVVYFIACVCVTLSSALEKRKEEEKEQSEA